MKHPARLLILLAAAAGLAGFAQAQGKIGLINSQDVLEKSAEGKRAIAQLQAADKKYGDDITRMDDQIKQLQNRLTTQRLTLTPEAAAGIQVDIQRKQTERQRAAEDATRTMQEMQAKTLSQIQEELVPLIEQLRKDMNLDLIFDLARGGTVYANPALDLTAEVIKRYDAQKAVPAKK